MFSSLLITTFFLPRNGTNVGDTSTEASDPPVDAELVFTRTVYVSVRVWPSLSVTVRVRVSWWSESTQGSRLATR